MPFLHRLKGTDRHGVLNHQFPELNWWFLHHDLWPFSPTFNQARASSSVGCSSLVSDSDDGDVVSATTSGVVMSMYATRPLGLPPTPKAAYADLFPWRSSSSSFISAVALSFRFPLSFSFSFCFPLAFHLPVCFFAASSVFLGARVASTPIFNILVVVADTTLRVVVLVGLSRMQETSIGVVTGRTAPRSTSATL